jgi:hypothetical protein
MVITQESAQSLAALNMPVAAGVCASREQQDITLPLVIPFGMEMFDIFAQRSLQRALAEHAHAQYCLEAERSRSRDIGNFLRFNDYAVDCSGNRPFDRGQLRKLLLRQDVDTCPHAVMAVTTCRRRLD